MDVAGYIPKICRDPAFNLVDVDLPAAAVNFFNYPDMAGNGDFFTQRRGLDDRPQFF